MDGDDDGIGDFKGLAGRLDHIAQLGANCIWLLPFYPSPRLDHGYDVTNYYDVAPELGTLGDFVEFSHQARLRGLRLIVDLPINHTSDQHPWFSRPAPIQSPPIEIITSGRKWSRRMPRMASCSPGFNRASGPTIRGRERGITTGFINTNPTSTLSAPRFARKCSRCLDFGSNLACPVSESM